MADLVHKRSDQKQPAAARPKEILRVRRIRDGCQVKTWSLIPDTERQLIGLDTHRHRDRPMTIRLLLHSLLDESLVGIGIQLTQHRTDLQVAVNSGIAQCFFQPDAQNRQLRCGQDAQSPDRVLQERDN